MTTPQSQPPEPPPQAAGSMPAWVQWLARKQMLVIIVVGTAFIMWSTHWTNQAAERAQVAVNKAAAKNGPALSRKEAADADEAVREKQAEIKRQQDDINRQLAALRQQGAAAQSGNQNATAPQLSPEQQSRQEIASAAIKARYMSLWSSPIVATREAPASSAASPGVTSAAAAQAPPAEAVPAAPVATPAMANSDPNKAQFPYDESVGPYHRILRDTVLGGVLMNELNSESGGMLIVQLDRGDQVYAKGTKIVLWPEGSQLLGEAKAITEGGQRLLGVSFNQIQMPDGYSISLLDTQGLSQGGETGLTGKVNTHWVSTLGWSVLLGGFAALSEIGNTTTGLTYSPSSVYRAQFSESMGQQAQQQLMQHVLNRPNTVIIPRGTRVKAALVQDLPGNPEYQNHRIAPGSI